METKQTGSHQTSKNHAVRAVLTQAQTNTTLWIGHLQTDPTDHFAGQTFDCPAEGPVDNIQVFTSAVQYPGEMRLTLHEFDPSAKQWGKEIANSSVNVEKADESQWVRFSLQPVMLEKGKTYGFRLKTPNALIGIGEAASGTKQPFVFGQEWNADSSNQQGHYFTYFSLAFRVELCA